MSEASSVTAPAEDYKSSASYRGAKAAVILLGVLLGLAFIMLVVGLVMKMSGHGPGGSADSPAIFTLAHGATIVSTEVSDNRLVLHVHSSAGDEIDIIDTQSGRLIGQVKPQ